MTSSDTLFATTRLTLGLSQHVTRPTLTSVPKHSSTTNEALDRRKRKRDDESHDTQEAMILTPGNTPLPRPLTIDPPLLAHRYLPTSLAGDGAFSQTILAEDTFSPMRQLVAIKAMKPGFELIGQQEYDLLRRIQNLPMPKHTCLPIVQASAAFSASSTYHIVLEALEPGQIFLPDCPHQPSCFTTASCPFRQSALRKIASQLLLGLSVLHDQMGIIHADLKPENILRCRAVSAHSMKLKLIDLGNAMPIDRTNIYYDDFEVQSIYYRAPEVLLGLPFCSAIDMFSVGLILAELLLSRPEPSPQVTRHRQPSFPSSPPQSHSPQRIQNVPLLSINTSNRRSFVEQIVRLLGPLPRSYRSGKFWNDEFAHETFGKDGMLLSQQLENEGVGSELIDFIMRMLSLQPEERISAKEALRHEWIVGPLLGYWAVLGFDWTPSEFREQRWERPVQKAVREQSIDSQSSSPDGHVSQTHVQALPPLYDFSRIEDDEDGTDEVSFVCSGSSPTKPLPFIETSKPNVVMDLEEHVVTSVDVFLTAG